MRFPHAENLRLPCQFTRVVPGALHADGRRYLPLLVFTLADGFELGVTDRHHRVDLALHGQPGVAQLVFLLSTIRATPPTEARLVAEEPGRRTSTKPSVYGQVAEVLHWEIASGHLPYQTLYTELILAVGSGTIGLRTSLTAPNISEAIGTPQLHSGDWLAVERSRIDVLGFFPA